LWAFTQDVTALKGGGQGVELTTDGARSWTNVTPPGLSVTGGNHWIIGIYPLSATKAWVVYGGGGIRSRQSLLYTGDAGHVWTKVGVLPITNCVPQFVTRRDGTCTSYGAALGSMVLDIYRTSNGGASWHTIFDNWPDVTSGRFPAGSLPFGCDKRVQFTSATRGWALFLCNGGMASLYETTDGGATWTDRPATPPMPSRYGSEFTRAPVFSGPRGAVAFATGNESLVYVTDNGGHSFTAVYPPERARAWCVDVVTPLQWRFAYRNMILATNDGGKSWFAFTDDARKPVVLDRYGPDAPDVTFANNRQGWLTWDEGNGFLLMRTTDGGREWKLLEVPGT
jgi:hypothetical protein